MTGHGGTRGSVKTVAAIAAVLIAVVVSPSFGEVSGRSALGQARLAVEQSAFSPEEKLALLTAMDKAIAAGVPADDTAFVATRALSRKEPASVASSLDAVARIKQQGLPVRLALDRIEQGLAKDVPGDRINAMLGRLSGDLEKARPMIEDLAAKKIVAPAQRDEAIETVARAYEKKIPADAVAAAGERVRMGKGSSDLFNRSIDTMTTFAGNGMPASEASRLVQSALERGYSERDLSAMERYMVDELRKNRPVRDIVSGMESSMEHGEMRTGADRMGSGTMRGAGPAGGGAGTGGRR